MGKAEALYSSKLLEMKYLLSKYTLIFIILSIFLNCFPAKKITPPEKITPEDVLEKACTYEENLKTFASRFSIRLKKDKKSLSTYIELLYKKPDQFTIYFKSRIGVNLLKVVFRNDSLFYFVPDENRFYSDSYDNFLKTDTWEWEIDLKTLLQFIVGKTGLDGPETRFLKSEGRYFVYILDDGEWVKRFWIDKKGSNLKKSFWVKKDGGESFSIKYERYKRFGEFHHPREIRIRSSSAERVEIKFKKLKFNLDLEEKKFKIEVPSKHES